MVLETTNMLSLSAWSIKDSDSWSLRKHTMICIVENDGSCVSGALESHAVVLNHWKCPLSKHVGAVRNSP